MILSILVVILIVVLLKFLIDYIGVPQPVNWVILAIVAVILVIVAIRNPFINI